MPKIMPLVHPKMLDSLQTVGFFPHLCRIEVNVGETVNGLPSVNSHNEPVPDWQTLPGHEALSCAVTANSGNEVRGEYADIDTNTHTIALRGYFPTVRAEMRAVIFDPPPLGTEPEVHDITRVNHDDLKRLTYLGTEIMRV